MKNKPIIKNIIARNYKRAFRLKSTYPIILHNVFPIFAIIFWNWDPVLLVYFYISETIIIGIINFFKIILSGGFIKNKDSSNSQAGLPGKIFLGIFFLVHYNAFNYGQVIFIAGDTIKQSGSFALIQFAEYMLSTESLKAAMILIFFSHAYSFVFDFILSGAYKKANPTTIMFLPYPRIFIQQFVAIFGGMIMLLLNAPAALFILLQILKMTVEIISHYVIDAEGEYAERYLGRNI